MQFNFNDTEYDDTEDELYAAMETGQTGRAREYLQYIQENNPEQAQQVRSTVVFKYGVHL